MSADHLYIDKNGNRISNPRFVVGPASHNERVIHGRDSLDCDRGPCKPSYLPPSVMVYLSILFREYGG